MTFPTIALLFIGLALVGVGAVIFSLYVRELFFAEPLPPEKCDWESNRWLDSKHTLLGTWRVR